MPFVDSCVRLQLSVACKIYQFKFRYSRVYSNTHVHEPV